MNRLLIVCLFTLGTVVNAVAVGNVTNSAPDQLFSIGGTPIAVPLPASEMTEVGNDNRGLMVEVLNDPKTRLVAAFVLTNDLPKLREARHDLLRYATVIVPRGNEFRDIDVNDFRELKQMAGQTIGKVVDTTEQASASDSEPSLSKPMQLGCFFSKEDAYGFGMAVSVVKGDTNRRMAIGGAMLRVKQRFFFAYLYSEYKDEETVKWIRRATETWADAILRANK